MRALGAIKEVFFFGFFGFGVRAVGVWVGDFCGLTELAGVDGVPRGDEGGESCCGEDIAEEVEC